MEEVKVKIETERERNSGQKENKMMRGKGDGGVERGSHFSLLGRSAGLASESALGLVNCVCVFEKEECV